MFFYIGFSKLWPRFWHLLGIQDGTKFAILAPNQNYNPPPEPSQVNVKRLGKRHLGRLQARFWRPQASRSRLDFGEPGFYLWLLFWRLVGNPPCGNALLPSSVKPPMLNHTAWQMWDNVLVLGFLPLTALWTIPLGLSEKAKSPSLIIPPLLSTCQCIHLCKQLMHI